MDGEQVKSEVSLSDAQAVVQYLRVFAEMLEWRLLAPEEDPWDEILSLRGENGRLVREQAEAKKLIHTLHKQLRQTQDELADLTVKYRKVCAEAPPSVPGNPGRASVVRRDMEKAAALEAAQDFEDGAVPGPVHRTCETCFRRNVESHCLSRKSRWAGLLVGAAQPACGEYVACPTPPGNAQNSLKISNGSLIGFAETTRTPTTYPTTVARAGPKPVSPPPVLRKGTCPSCGHTICFNQGGTPYKHDVNGKVYRGYPGRVADKKRPCPGQAVQA